MNNHAKVTVLLSFILVAGFLWWLRATFAPAPTDLPSQEYVQRILLDCQAAEKTKCLIVAIPVPRF